jgi:hypothetical protein
MPQFSNASHYSYSMTERAEKHCLISKTRLAAGQQSSQWDAAQGRPFA